MQCRILVVTDREQTRQLAKKIQPPACQETSAAGFRQAHRGPSTAWLLRFREACTPLRMTELRMTGGGVFAGPVLRLSAEPHLRKADWSRESGHRGQASGERSRGCDHGGRVREVRQAWHGLRRLA